VKPPARDEADVPHGIGPGPVARWRLFGVLRVALLISLAGAVVALAVLSLVDLEGDAGFFGRGGGLLLIGVVSLVTGFIDYSLGMGHGTLVSPVLFVFGFDALQIIPAVLASEVLAGVVAGVLHQRFANIDLGRRTQDFAIVRVAVPFGVIAAVAGAAAAVGMDGRAGDVVLGVVVLIAGGFVIAGRGRLGSFSLRKAGVLGAAAGTVKALVGGGYGPALTGGQIALGRPGRNAVGVTTVSEAAVALAGFAVFAVLHGAPNWDLVLALSIGALLATPAAAWTVRLVPDRGLTAAVGVTACAFGLIALLRALVG